MANYKLDANMISYWLMEQATAANAPDGMSANELTKQSDAGGPTRSTDHKEGSYSADLNAGSYDYYSRADANLSAGFPGKDSGGGTGSFSVGAWFMLDASDASLIGKDANGEQMSFRLKISSTPKFYFAVSGNGWGETGITGGTTPNVAGATWYHVVGVFDTTTNLLYLYVNGASDATAVSFTGDIYLGDSELRIGRFDGHVDEAFIMSRALSASEVEEIYTYGLEGAPAASAAYPYHIFNQ